MRFQNPDCPPERDLYVKLLKPMIAPLAKFIDWSAIQAATLKIPSANVHNPQLEEALKFVKRPDFIPAESQPAQIEFDPGKFGLHFRFPTPKPGEVVENNVVYGRFYRCAEQ